MFKNIKYLSFLGLLIFCLTSCDQEGYDFTEETTIDGEPVFEAPELKVNVRDNDGNVISDALLHFYFDGEKKITLATDTNGEVMTELPIDANGEVNTLIFCEKEEYNDNVLRIDSEHIQSGEVDVILNNYGGFFGGSNVQGMLNTEVIKLNGSVTDNFGNPGGFIVIVFEEDFIAIGDTSVFIDYAPIVNGDYEILVPSNTELYLCIIELSDCTFENFTSINEEDLDLGSGLYAELIGGFFQDTTLPTNNNGGQNGSSESILEVVGSLKDCIDQPMANTEVILAVSNFSGFDTLEILNTDQDGNFFGEINRCNISSTSLVLQITPDPSTGLAAYTETLGFDSSLALLDFGDIEICYREYLQLSDGTNEIFEENLEILNYDEANGVLDIVVINSFGNESMLFEFRKDTSGMWFGQKFEVAFGSTIAYVNTESFNVDVADFNDGFSLKCDITNLEIEFAEPFPLVSTFEGAIVVNK